MSYTADNLPQNKHYFFDRHGGVSRGKYASLNASLHSLDVCDNIFKNLEIAANHYRQPLQNLAILTQGVSNHAVYVAQPSQYQISADGMVTNKSDIILALRTADCAPILFYDHKNKIIGAAHAGWRGALHGIIENTLNLMLSLGAEKKHIAAAVGPCLQKISFFCQKDMYQEFLQTDSLYQKFFTIQDDIHWLFDAEKFCVHRLHEYGIESIEASGINTYTDENYFSYRRSCHQNLVTVPRDFPSHLSTIML